MDVAAHGREGRAKCRALRPVLAEDRVDRLRGDAVSPDVGRALKTMVPGALARARIDPDLGDICLGVLESQPRAAVRAWRAEHGVDEAPEGGESRLAALARYARGAAPPGRAGDPALEVTHNQPIRYLLNVLAGAKPDPRADAAEAERRSRTPSPPRMCSAEGARTFGVARPR